MKSTSKVIMAATLVMVVSLAIVLVLFLVLLAELYCSLLLRSRRQRRCFLTLPTTSIPTDVGATSADPSASHYHLQSTSPLSNFYSQGVIQPPPSFLFPSSLQFSKNTQNKTHHLRENALSSSPQPIVNNSNNYSPTSCVGGENFVYISNPIYVNEATEKPGTPFETPDSSPSRLETCGSSSGDDDGKEVAGGGGGAESPAGTPPLTPMKSLPEKASSVSLRDARSLETSGSDSNINNGGSSSSTGSACASPSW